MSRMSSDKAGDNSPDAVDAIDTSESKRGVVSGEPPAPPAGIDLLFGRVVRPPRILWNQAPVRSAKLVSVDSNAVRSLPGVVDVVVRGNFVGVVASSESAAAHAAAKLRIKWSLPQPESRSSTARQEIVVDRGDASAALHGHPNVIEGTYRWPFKPASADSACWAIADFRNNAVTVWAVTAIPAALRAEIAALLGIAEPQVTLVSMQGAPDHGQQAHDAAADAALLSQTVGRPVQLRLTPDDIQAGDEFPYQLVSHISSVVDDDGAISAYAVATGATPASAPPLALVLTGTATPITEVPGTSDVAIPPYAFANLRVTAAEAGGAAPVADPAGTARVGHVFAHESHLDEIAAAKNIDPVALRLQQLDDPRGAKLVRTVAEQAGWEPRSSYRNASTPGIRRGRGFAYASVIEEEGNKGLQSWSAWVVNVEVDSFTGDLSVSRVVVGQEMERAEPADTNRLKDEVIEATRILTSPSPSFNTWDAAAAPLADMHGQVPAVQIVGESTMAQPVLRAGGSAMLPAAAAVANAIFDATGVRLREPPFSADRIRLALEGQGAAAATGKLKRNFFMAGALAAAGVVASVMPWRAPIAPVAPPEPGFYSAGAIERGRLVAAAGDCVVCHTAPNGTKNAGGLALETPFGTIYTTNITPDPETGIGKWSYAAFERAMREGVHRDGRRLYPAFPYTAFAKVSDADMQALYAYLMSEPAAKSEAPETKLAFPFNVRPLMAGWNLLFHRNKPFEPNPAQSIQWNRGAYLAEGLGHCSACHTPRNAFGAEKSGKAYLAGGVAEGWEAPPLTSLSHAPVPWTEDALFRYLRFGYSPLHGPAAGPMAPVIEGLAELPESDVRAIAVYIASFNKDAPADDLVAAKAEQLERHSRTAAMMLTGPGSRIYQGACAVCHEADQGTQLFGEKPPLALNTNLHSALPGNVIQVLMKGIEAPPSIQVGYMPAFADSLNDQQLTELTHYLRARFAPDKPAWQDVGDTVKRIRSEGDRH